MNAKYLIVLLSWFIIPWAYTQNIVSGEYFFDTAPTLGSGTSFSLSSGADVSHQMTIPTTSLTAGFHNLFIRVKNNLNVWSPYEGRVLYILEPGTLINPEIVSGEWFIDTDPGLGNGTSFNVTSGSTVTSTLTIPNTLSPGFHNLFIRVKNNINKWSPYEGRMFYVLASESLSASNIVSGEWYMNSDPGTGNGNAFSLSPSSMIQASLEIPTNSLPAGFNNLFIRVKNDLGQWSHYEGRMFYILNEELNTNKKITSGEWFVDTDPGIGKGTAIIIPTADTVSALIDLNTLGLVSGKHNLFIRVKDASDKWSMYEGREFIICNEILPSPAITGDIQLCNGETLMLDAGTVPGALSYLWKGPNGFTASSQVINISNVTESNEGTYSVVAVRGNTSCDTSKSNSAVVVINSQPDLTLVANKNTLTVATSDAVYQWIKCEKANSVIPGETAQNYTITASGNYAVIVTANGCSTTSSCYAAVYIPEGEIPFTANFDFFNDSTNLKVNFTDLSASNTSSWYWTMGDGKVLTTQNPVYTYSKPGIYSVCLTAIDNTNLQFQSVCREVSVGEIACSVSSDFSFFINPDELKVSFTDQTDGGVTDYYWSFGDGNTSTLANPVYSYSTAGYYLVGLSVRNSVNGCMDVSAQYIQVGSIDCRAGFTFGVDPVSNSVNFKDDSKGDIDYYYWDFGDGTFSVQQNPDKIYKNEGIFLAGQTVIDNENGCIDLLYQPVQVGEVDCSADFESYIDASSITAYFTNKNLGEATALLWSFGDGRFSTKDNPVHVFSSAGIYAVGLNTYDFNSDCMDYYEEMLLIGELANDCEADFIYILDPSTPEVTFKNKSIGDIVGSVWNFGDGSENSEDMDPVHTFTKGGYQYVCLNVINSQGIRNITCKWVMVAGSAADDCRADFMFSVDSAVKKVTFVDNSFGEINKYSWDFGDSGNDSVSILKDPVHTYDEKGYYLVKLKVENTASGCVSSEYKLLNVAESQVLKAGFGYEAKDPDKKLSGYPVDMVSASSGDGATVEWDFGDKQIKKAGFTVMDSTSGKVTHYYQLPGKYRVCLRISDPTSGQTDEYCNYVFTKNAVNVKDLFSQSAITLDVYPNPFIDNTTINYYLPESQYVEIAVFDQLGRRIETMEKSRKEKGNYQISWEAKNHVTGIYHLKLITQDIIITRQLVINR